MAAFCRRRRQGGEDVAVDTLAYLLRAKAAFHGYVNAVCQMDECGVGFVLEVQLVEGRIVEVVVKHCLAHVAKRGEVLEEEVAVNRVVIDPDGFKLGHAAYFLGFVGAHVVEETQGDEAFRVDLGADPEASRCFSTEAPLDLC